MRRFPDAALVAAILAAATMDALNSTALSIAGAHAMGGLDAAADAFALANVAFVAARLVGFPLAATIGARFGARRALAAAVALAAASSLACALAGDVAAFVAFRAVQGAAGAVLVVLGQSLLFETLPSRRQGTVQAVYALAAVMLPNTLAPWLEGWLADSVSWAWIFAAGVPLGAFALGALWAAGPGAPGATRASRPDPAGLTLLVVGAPALVFVLQRGERWDWLGAPMIGALACVALAALAWLAARQRRGLERGALLDLAVFRDPNVIFGFSVTFVAGAALYGSGFLVPAFAMSVLGYPAQQAGALLAPSGAAIALGLLFAGALMQYRRLLPLKLVPFGIGLFMLAMWMFSRSASASGGAQLWLPLALRGFGLGLLFMALTLLMLGGLRGARIAHGVALFNIGRQLGGLAGVAFLQRYLDWRVAVGRAVLGAHFSPANPAFAERQSSLAAMLAARGLEAAQAAHAATTLIAHALQRQLAVLAFDDAFITVALLFVAATPVLLGIKLAQRRLGARLGAPALPPAALRPAGQS